MVPSRFIAAAFAAVLCTSTAADDAIPPLRLDEAARLALSEQPQLEAQRAAIRAAHERAVSAAQLPDPVLIGGLGDLTVTGADRYTLSEESDTQFLLGIRQPFPGGNKRALRGERALLEAERLSAELTDQQRMQSREASMAWLAVWKAVRAQQIVSATRDEAQRQLANMDIAYRSGRGSQAELLAARVAVELEEDRLDARVQDEAHARNQLRRWLPADAQRPLALQLPAFPAPDLAGLLETLAHHPHVAAQTRAVAVAEADLALARAATRPDWSAQLSYGHRPEFADYASLGFEMDLPVFARNRQHRDAAASAAELDRSAQLKQDWLRQHRAELQLNVEDWQRLQQRLARYDALILPATHARLDAAVAAYGAGSDTLASVLDARRARLDLQLQRLDLEFDTAMHEVSLRYFDHSATAPENAP